MVARGSKLIEGAKDKYSTKIGRTIANLETGKKVYWSLINKILNKAKITKQNNKKKTKLSTIQLRITRGVLYLNVRDQITIFAGELQ